VKFFRTPCNLPPILGTCPLIDALQNLIDRSFFPGSYPAISGLISDINTTIVSVIENGLSFPQTMILIYLNFQSFLTANPSLKLAVLPLRISKYGYVWAYYDICATVSLR
jgi:hypothetical protein